LLQAVEIENMLCIAEMIVRGALARKESRGAHFRSDYPHEDRKWLENIAVRKGAKRMEVKTYPCIITALKP
jgi:succinate dehydrogenase / fumarate reductase flavoprotein subunit